MKKTLVALALGAALAACGDNAAPDNTREIHKDIRPDSGIPFQALDQALQQEGVIAARAIVGRLKYWLLTHDKAKLASEFGGAMTPAKLAKLGITEAELKGTYYIATDYTLSFSGSTVTISASKAGTRGYVSEAFML